MNRSPNLQPSNIMTLSPLLALPAELRNEIFGLALTHSDGITIREQLRKFAFDSHSTQLLSQAQALTRTCKQIHKECGLLFYSCNDFTLNLSPFFAYVVVTRSFISRFIGISDGRDLPRSLTVVLPDTAKTFDMMRSPDYDKSEGLVPRITQPWRCFTTLSFNLSCFQHQHPDMRIELHVPIHLEHLRGRSEYIARVDFKVGPWCVDKAFNDLQEVSLGPDVNQHDLGPVSIRLAKWRETGFVQLGNVEKTPMSEDEEEHMSDIESDYGSEHDHEDQAEIPIRGVTDDPEGTRLFDRLSLS